MKDIKFGFIKDKTRLWIEVGSENIGLFVKDEKGNPIQVAIKIEGKDLLELWNILNQSLE